MKISILIFVIALGIQVLIPESSYAGCIEYRNGYCYKCTPSEWLYGSGCQPCPSNATCNGQGYSCKSGYYTFGPPGCEPCPANATCSGTSTVTCRSGYYRSDYNKCSPCPANATCTSSDFTCYTGYKKEGNSCVKNCDSSCKTCTDNGYCATCDSDKFLYMGYCSTCPDHAICNGTDRLKCETGYYNFGPPLCLSCPANATCSGTGTLTCQEGYYRSNYAECSACSEGCKSCSNSTYCTACFDGYTLNGNSCRKACPVDTIDLGYQCYPCPEHGTCNGTADHTCEKGYYSFNTPLCIPCPVGATCNEQTDSFTCNEGYYQTNYAECSPCPAGCKTCRYLSYNVASCQTCYDGYNLEGDECVLSQTVNTCPARMILSSDGCCCLNK